MRKMRRPWEQRPYPPPKFIFKGDHGVRDTIIRALIIALTTSAIFGLMYHMMR